MNKLSTPLRRGVAVAALAVVLCSPAATAWGQPAPARSFLDMVKGLQLVPPGKQESELLGRVAAAVEALQQMDLPRAQLAANEALQLDARNGQLHLLNGFIYHLQAKQGDTQKAEIAIEGYQQALRIDPANWIAQEFLGLAYMDLKQFQRAKAQFTDVLLLTPDSTVSIEGLMVSSYLTGDAPTACAMADQLRHAAPALNPEAVRSSITVYASCGNFDQAERMRELLRQRTGSAAELERAERRLAQWKALYRRHEQQGNGMLQTSLKPHAAGGAPALAEAPTQDAAPLLLAQAFPLPKIGSPRAAAAAPAAAPAPAPAAAPAPSPSADAAPSAPPSAPPIARADAGSDPSGPRMVLIDVVLLSTQELVSTAKGVNLLSALTLQLGSLAGNVAAFSRVFTSSSSNTGVEQASTAITRAVTVPALSYSLNIANANNSVNEVLARPTLAAIEGLPSEFFSGTNLNAGIVSVSQQGGTTVVPLDKRFGIKLAVTPQFLSQGQVQLKVEAQRTSLNASSENSRVAYQIEIGETTANANVVMRLGDTLVLSGLSEKSSASSRDGVPGLQDVPGVQYLFSNKRTSQIQRSVLILVTPRAPAQVAESQGAADNMADNMKALRDKFGLAASVPSNVEAIMNQMKPTEFFREFRQGDVAMERWDRMRTTGDRLREALGFLYY